MALVWPSATRQERHRAIDLDDAWIQCRRAEPSTCLSECHERAGATRRPIRRRARSQLDSRRGRATRPRWSHRGRQEGRWSVTRRRIRLERAYEAAVERQGRVRLQNTSCGPTAIIWALFAVYGDPRCGSARARSSLISGTTCDRLARQAETRDPRPLRVHPRASCMRGDRHRVHPGRAGRGGRARRRPGMTRKRSPQSRPRRTPPRAGKPGELTGFRAPENAHPGLC